MISIITPIYNKELYIEKCIKSIINQSYKDWELILVDDGSTDNSASICKEFVKKDSRIKYYFQENQGPGSARNNGISKANGDFLIFVDSDDYLNQDYLKILIRESENDLVISGYSELYCDKDKFIQVAPPTIQIEKLEDLTKIIFNKDIFKFFVAPWCKLYKTSIIINNNILFKDIPYGEDVIFNFNYIKFCSKISLVSSSEYINRIVSGTLSRRHIENMTSYLEEVEKAALELFANNTPDSYKLQYLYVRDLKLLLINELESYQNFKKICNIVKVKYIKKIKINTLDYKDKLLLKLLKFKFYLLAYVIMKQFLKEN